MRKSVPRKWTGVVDRERPFTPPPSSAGSWVWVLLLVAGMAALTAVGYQRWTGRSLQWPWHTDVARPVVASPPPKAVTDQASHALPAEVSPTSASPSSPSVSRVSPSPRTSVSNGSSATAYRSEPRQPSTVTVYRCKTYQGGRFWSSSHCRDHGALVDRMETVPARLSPPMRIEVARSQAQSREAGARQVLVAEQRSARANQREVNAANEQCEAINRRIESIDAEARQPLSGRRQDQLREERQALRSRQFQLGC